MGTASRTSPRGVADCACASLSAASPSARMRAARSKQVLAGVGQRQPPRGAVEQPRAEPLLQPGDRLGDRGLGQLEVLGGQRKGAQFDDLGEDREPFEIRELST